MITTPNNIWCTDTASDPTPEYFLNGKVCPKITTSVTNGKYIPNRCTHNDNKKKTLIQL